MPTFRTGLAQWLRETAGLRVRASAAAPASVSGETPTPDSDRLTAGFHFTAPVALRDLTCADGQPKKLPTFDITAYTGVLMNVDQFYYPVVLELSGLRAARAETAVLLDHKSDQIVGQGKATIDAAGCRIQGQMTGGEEDPICKKVKTHAVNGFQWQASIGATVTRREMLEAGKKAIVNGREISGPAIIAREAVLNEVSFVALGADGQTSAAVAASQSAGDNAMNFEQWLAAKNFDVAKLSADMKASLRAAYDLELKAGAATSTTPATPAATSPATGPAPLQAGATQPALVAQPVTAAAPQAGSAVADAISALRAENARIGKIQELCAGGHTTIQAEAIEKGWTAEVTELAVLRAGRGAGPAVHVVGKPEEQPLAIEAALCINAGVSQERMKQWYKPDVLDRCTAQQYRSMTLTAMYFHVMHAAGVYARPGRLNDESIRAAFQADAKLKASGFSSMSLTNILENVAGKSLVNAYQAQEVVWPFICATTNNSDFKPHARYRLDSTGAFRKVGADGELKHAGLSDAKYANQLDTYGCLIVLTRQMQYDDDLNAFVQLPKLIGELGAQRQEESVMVLLLGNTGSFFSAGNGNLVTGAGGAMGVTGLTAVEKKFSDQINSNKKPILTPPKQILTGTGNFTDAETLYKEKLMQAAAGAPMANPHVGKYPPRKSPYLNNTAIKDQDGKAITGQSATIWFLLADPAQRAAIVMALLNGQATPTVRSGETDMTTLGVSMQAFHDWGVAFEDPAGAVRADGA